MIKVGRIVVVYLFEQHSYLLDKSNFVIGSRYLQIHLNLMEMKRSRNNKAKEVGGESFLQNLL